MLKMSYIYIVSSKSNPGRYKVGITSTQERLEAIPDMKVHRMDRVSNPRGELDSMLRALHSYRIHDINGKASSWLECPIEHIIKELNDILSRQGSRCCDGGILATMGILGVIK